jgi:hypothetical protein
MRRAAEESTVNAGDIRIRILCSLAPGVAFADALRLAPGAHGGADDVARRPEEELMPSPRAPR